MPREVAKRQQVAKCAQRRRYVPAIGELLLRGRQHRLRRRGRWLQRIRRRAPIRLVGTVAPVARAVEGVEAVPRHDVHVADPVRPDVSGMIVRRLVDLRQPDPGVQRLGGDAVRPLPRAALVDRLRLAVAGEGELAGQMPVRVLIHHRADVLRIIRREHAVQHHLRHRLLAARRLVARLEIDRLREALLGFVVVLALQFESLRRAQRRLRQRQDGSTPFWETPQATARRTGWPAGPASRSASASRRARPAPAQQR